MVNRVLLGSWSFDQFYFICSLNLWIHLLPVCQRNQIFLFTKLSNISPSTRFTQLFISNIRCTYKFKLSSCNLESLYNESITITITIKTFLVSKFTKIRLPSASSSWFQQTLKCTPAECNTHYDVGIRKNIYKNAQNMFHWGHNEFIDV